MKKFKLLGAMLLSIGMLLGMGTMSTSCRGDDGNSEIPSIPTTPTDSIDTSKPEEKPFVGGTYFEDSVKIQFQLLNSDSIATDTFKEGEDIIFKLTVKNISNDWVTITTVDKFCDNTFNVYSSDGVDMGRPWNLRLIGAIRPFLTTGMMQEHICSWLEVPLEDIDQISSWLEDPIKYLGNMDLEMRILSLVNGITPIAYLTKERRQPLPKGSYYTQFDVSVLEGRTTTIRMDFNIE